MKYFLILLIMGVNLLQVNALEIVRDGKTCFCDYNR